MPLPTRVFGWSEVPSGHFGASVHNGIKFLVFNFRSQVVWSAGSFL